MNRVFRFIDDFHRNEMKFCFKTFRKDKTDVCLSSDTRKPTMWLPNRSDTNQAVQAQKMARDWNFQIYKVEEQYYMCSKNKGADQFRSYCEADLRLCFRVCKMLVFS